MAKSAFDLRFLDRRRQELDRFDAERLGQLVKDIDARCVNFAL